MELQKSKIHKLKEFKSKTGGNNAKDNLHRLLQKTLTNECALKCSWKGFRNNFKISNLYFIKIMKREVTSRYTVFTVADFDAIIAEWLRFANQRNKRDTSKEEQ
ncbi:uncharacterized protein LOC112589259 [Harpegnathos saltator]|uniref:uncharacterized protein LOC112589259 n=1 Tax=Harpegnathos saltator TaxID=610380 RepID=UPI000DBEF220|nr:uncharacterized protein LOC112589259 [Harpegnathos saltator]